MPTAPPSCGPMPSAPSVRWALFRSDPEGWWPEARLGFPGVRTVIVHVIVDAVRELINRRQDVVL